VIHDVNEKGNNDYHHLDQTNHRKIGTNKSTKGRTHFYKKHIIFVSFTLARVLDQIPKKRGDLVDDAQAPPYKTSFYCIE
jgi:hypothetical protein